MVKFGFFVNNRLIRFSDRMVCHNRSRRFTEHIFQLDIDRFYAVRLFEDKLHVVSSLAYHIHRGTFTIRDTFYTGYIFFFHQ